MLKGNLSNRSGTANSRGRFLLSGLLLGSLLTALSVPAWSATWICGDGRWNNNALIGTCWDFWIAPTPEEEGDGGR